MVITKWKEHSGGVNIEYSDSSGHTLLEISGEEMKIEHIIDSLLGIMGHSINLIEKDPT